MTAGSHSRPIDTVASDQGDGYLLQSEADLAKAATYAIEKSAVLGAAEAMARVNETGGINVHVANNAVETAVRDGSQSLQITVYENGRTGSASTEALNRRAIDRAVEQAVAMARQLEPDEDAGLAERDMLAWDTPSVPMFAPSNHDALALTRAAMELEAAVLATPTPDRVRVTQAGAASQDMRSAIATSLGFCRTASGSVQERWCQTIAERGDEMVQSYWASTDRRLEGLEPNDYVGRQAAERTLAILGAQNLGTRRSPVLVDSTAGADLVGALCGQLTGMSQYRRMTFIPDAIGQTIAASHLTLVEDPFEPFGLASAAYDNEGVAGARRDIVKDGVVAGLFLDTRTSRKLRLTSTGNAGGMRNLRLASSLTNPADDLPAMLKKLGTGLWVTRFVGGGTNPATGAYSSAAAGFWVENGEVVGPVHGFTIAGNLKDMLLSISALGADVHRAGNIRTGSILLPELQIAGR